MNGGEPGKRGLNLLKKSNGQIINVGGKKAVPVEAGDIYEMLTPGGGGYGDPNTSKAYEENKGSGDAFVGRGSVYEYQRAQESV